ncbi:hypothetical protein [Actinoalloteichus caeruleus]|uniref:hypothetical protein n=1 Tax=Actinoalloteichus cyanogriseus TaxID=2893586 RepID=UPI003BB8BEEA
MTTESDLQVTFSDHLMPQAVAGVYTIRTEQHLTQQGADITSADPLPAVEQAYEIRAVRFLLDDSSVHASYPDAGATGDFRRTLPHITLDRAILPWERQLDATRADVREPWLALLVFRAGELDEDPDGRGVTTTRTVEKLCRPDDDTVLGPDLTVTPEVAQTRCQTIDVDAELFTRTVPRAEELRYLAHVRDVRPLSRLRVEGEVLTEGQYAVLTANRFPRAPGSYAVHLVSLEGFHDRLAPGRLPTGTRAVRLCALRSWSFTCDPTGHLDVGGLLRGLARPAVGGHAENLALRLVTDTPKKPDKLHEALEEAQERLRLGYVPVVYRVPSGELTFAWYRGPFTPVAPRPVPRHPTPHTTADHALIYHAERGVFDVSYAAAWTLGRLLALTDPDYAAETTRARREAATLAVNLMALGADPARERLDPDTAAGHATSEIAATGFGDELVAALAAPQVPGAVPQTRRSRLSRAESRAWLEQARNQDLLRGAVSRRTETAPGWLDELVLLRRVPFRYLVPHPGMLPPESLRMFRVDPAWVDALLAGARDVGVHTSLDARINTTFRQDVDHRRTGTSPVAGIVVRSRLVRAWPVFDLLATREDGRAVTELRRDRLAPDVLLCLFDAVPDEIVIREPGQGIHFGIDSADVIGLRSVTPGKDLGVSLGRDFPAQGTGTVFSAYLRNVDQGTPDVLQLRGPGGLVSDLAAQFGLSDLSPGQFALQLVNAPVEQRLTHP